MAKHYLYYVDREYKTAYCSVCGPADIYVAKGRTGAEPKVFCLNRLREIKMEAKRRLAEMRRLDPNWKPRHQLSKIDVEAMTAICSVCGPTDIQKRSRNKNVPYICTSRVRPYMRDYRRSHYKRRNYSSNIHTLSEINEENKTAICSLCGPVEIYVWQGKRKIGRRCSNASVDRVVPAQKIRRETNIRIISEFKIERGCQSCGDKSNPDELYLRALNPHAKGSNFEKLIKLNRKNLILELVKSIVFCADCQNTDYKVFDASKQGGAKSDEISRS